MTRNDSAPPVASSRSDLSRKVDDTTQELPLETCFAPLARKRQPVRGLGLPRVGSTATVCSLPADTQEARGEGGLVDKGIVAHSPSPHTPLPSDGGNSLKKRLLGFFFLDRFSHKNATVWIAAFHYLPLLAMIFGVTVNGLLHVFFSVVYPLIDDPLVDPPVASEPDAAGFPVVVVADPLRAAFALRTIVAHVGVFAAVCMLGYKCMALVLDAMLDCCLFVLEPSSRELISYYATLADLRLIWKNKHQLLLFLVLLFASPCAVYLTLVTDVFRMKWSPQDSSMFSFSMIVQLVAFAGVSLSFLRLVKFTKIRDVKEGGWVTIQPTSRDVTMWWSRQVPRWRRRSIYAVLLAACGFYLEGGGSQGMLSMSEGMLYIVITHVWLLGIVRVVRCTTSIADVAQFLVSNKTFRRAALVAAVPYVLWTGCSVSYFPSMSIFALQTFPFVMALVALKKLLQLQLPHYCCGSRSGALVAPWSTVIGVVVTVLFCNTKAINRHVPHYRASIVVRTFLRILIAFALFLVVSLSIWIALQQSNMFQIDPPTSCEAVGVTGDRIRVTAGYMIADLFGLPENISFDPTTLVYEEKSFLYDPRRYQSICGRWWRSMHAADLAYFSLMAYLPANSTSFRSSFDFFRKYRQGGNGWESLPGVHKRGAAVFHHFRNAIDNISVIAIRGTDMSAPHDFLQNILVFGETFIFDILSAVVPFGNMISDKVKADFFAASQTFSSSFVGDDNAGSSSNGGGEETDEPLRGAKYFYHTHVERYIAQHVDPNDKVVLTGHSLGGVVAQIVASRKRLDALAFSSPGIGLIYKKFDIPLYSIDAYTANVVASNDYIPNIDKSSGNVQHIQCEHTRAQICHSIELHTIRMWSMCPQYRHVVRVNGSYVLTPQPHEVLWKNLLEMVGTV